MTLTPTFPSTLYAPHRSGRGPWGEGTESLRRDTGVGTTLLRDRRTPTSLERRRGNRRLTVRTPCPLPRLVGKGRTCTTWTLGSFRSGPGGPVVEYIWVLYVRPETRVSSQCPSITPVCLSRTNRTGTMDRSSRKRLGDPMTKSLSRILLADSEKVFYVCWGWGSVCTP